MGNSSVALSSKSELICDGMVFFDFPYARILCPMRFARYRRLRLCGVAFDCLFSAGPFDACRRLRDTQANK